MSGERGPGRPESGGAGRALGPSAYTEIEGGLAFFQGKIRPLSEATVSVATHGLNYGTACFEGLRAYWNPDMEQLFILHMDRHLERFTRSCALLHLRCPYSAQELGKWMVRLLREGAVREDVYIRPLAFKAARVIKVALEGLRDEVALFYTPMGDYVSPGGLSLQVSSWQRVSDRSLPKGAKASAAYMSAALAIDQAMRDGYDDAVLLGKDGHVAEASSANIFLVRAGALVTPPLSEDILEGVTRSAVIVLAKSLGLQVAERPVSQGELYTADEVFLTGTGAQIAPVSSIDGHAISGFGSGKVVGLLQDAYFRAARGLEPAFGHWLTPVLEGRPSAPF